MTPASGARHLALCGVMPTLRAAAQLLLLASATLLTTATAAGAATIGVGAGLTYTAAPGEANALAITRAGDQIRFRDAVAIAAPGCDGDGTTEVACPAVPAPASIVVALDDGDDRLTAGPLLGAPVLADGGAGADRLDAGGATDYVALAGAAGDDALLAGTGESDLTGGPGADALTGGPAGAQTTYLMGAAADGADQVAGGAGFDIAGYGERTTPLRLTAGAGGADDGAAGEGDEIAAAVERLEGGAAADVIGGGPGLSELSGGGGGDQLSGGDGPDLLSGGDGDDQLAGGAGEDLAAPSPAIAALGAGGPQPGPAGSGADAGADAFSGGDGFDEIDYATRTAALAITLDGQANDGEAGERDNVGADVEGLTGGPAGDAITGSNRAERLTGNGGADTLEPGRGRDEVRAGAGDDVVRAQDGSGEWIDCGAGTDTMTGDSNDIPIGCETATLAARPAGRDKRKPTVRISGLPQRPRFQHVRRGLRPRLRPDEPVSFVVELQATLTRFDARASAPYNLTLVKRTFKKRSASTRRVTLKPNRKLLGRRRKIRVRIKVTATDAAGNVRVVSRTLAARR